MRQEVDVKSLAADISEFLKHPQGSSHNVIVGSLMAAYLVRKYSVAKKLVPMKLVDGHPADLVALLKIMKLKDVQQFANTVGKRTRAKPATEKERLENLKVSKNKYERGRRGLREGLIEQQFGGRPAFNALDPRSPLPPTGPCLDKLLHGGAVRMAGDVDSLENLLGMDRHRFPKSLPRERRGRNLFYNLSALVKCMTALLEDQQWLTDPRHRKQVLTGVIERAHKQSPLPEIADFLTHMLHPYLS
jgi:hypothetical protein